MKPNSSGGRRSAREEFLEGVVDAVGAEVGFAVEGLAKVVHTVGVAVEEFDDGQAVVIGLVERVEDLVAGER